MEEIQEIEKKEETLEETVKRLSGDVEALTAEIEKLNKKNTEIEETANRSLALMDELLSVLVEYIMEFRRKYLKVFRKDKKGDRVLDNVVLRFYQEMIRVTRVMRFGRKAKLRIIKRRN